MSKWTCLILTVLLMASLTVSVYSETTVLIDFNKLKANGNGSDASKSLAENDPAMLDFKNHDQKNRKEHMPTLLDYAQIAGSNFNPEELKGMTVSLSAYNWNVFLNSSAAHNDNKAHSYCIEWHTKYVKILSELIANDQKAADGTAAPTTTNEPQGYTILGIRVKFPETNYNNWALIVPPFEIPAYENRNIDFKGAPLPQEEMTKKENYGSKFENGYGVIKNVGNIKQIDIRVYGCQFKNSMSILLKDDNMIVTEYQFPQYLDFDGWRKLSWVNPNYITTAANRDLYIVPLYPRSMPFVKLDGFRIYRQGDQIGGDFVTYIKDVVITYDLAVLDKDQPIDHEEAWQILKDRQVESKNMELKQIGHDQILQFLERKKMHQEANVQ